MRKSILVAAVLGVAISTVAKAENTPAQKPVAVPPVKSMPAQQKASQAVRLSDAELDRITAGGAEVIQGDGLTIVLNPGNSNILKYNKNHIVCINCL
jgi:hypothetical protein